MFLKSDARSVGRPGAASGADIDQVIRRDATFPARTQSAANIAGTNPPKFAFVLGVGWSLVLFHFSR